MGERSRKSIQERFGEGKISCETFAEEKDCVYFLNTSWRTGRAYRYGLICISDFVQLTGFVKVQLSRISETFGYLENV